MKKSTKLFRKAFLVMFTFLSYSVNSQNQDNNYYAINFNLKEVDKPCKKCMDSLNSAPEDVKIILEVEGNKVIFGINDIRWYKKLFVSSKIGVAVDIIPSNIYSCQNESKQNHPVIKGTMTKPVYRNEFERRNFSMDNSMIYSVIAEIPEEMLSMDYEINWLLVYKKNICSYGFSPNFQGSKFDLLEMEYYADSLHAANVDLKSDSLTSHEITLKKSMFFTVPFEKGKYTYKPEDVEYIIDSLRLTDYEIKEVFIQGFSSVDGSVEKNVQLQENRAKSIADALQSFQKYKFKTQVTSSENWLQFKKDITNSPYSYLLALTKEEIKEKLESKELIDELESILQKERKATLRINLIKKTNYDSLSS
jgi:hypothetical protein